MKEIYRKVILLGMVLFIVIGIIYNFQKGRAQDKRFLEESYTYQLSLSLLENNDYENAEKNLLELHKKYENQANVTANLGLAYAYKGDMENAAYYYQKAVEQRPFLIQNPLFSIQFAEILIAIEEYESARQYLDYCKKLDVPEEYMPRLEELIAFTEFKK